MEPLAEKPVVSLEKTAIGYDPDKVILENIRLSVMPGEMVALVGRNGTGKSTLLKSIIGLLPLLAGNCSLFGSPIEKLNLRRRALLVSYVSSRIPDMPPTSVRELVSLGRMPHTGWTGRHREQDRKLVKKAVSELGMENFTERKVDQLSDGECRRVMIARAFAQDTPLMVLDEPTAFLDIPNKYELIRILGRFRDGGKSIIFSTHDLETAWMWADKFWVIHRGRIRQGAPEDLALRSVFDDLFTESGITFDHSLRRFVPHTVARGTLTLEGEMGPVMDWTRTALGRLGFRTTQESGDATIRIRLEGDRTQWELIRGGQKNTFESIYYLARFLIRAE